MVSSMRILTAVDTFSLINTFTLFAELARVIISPGLLRRSRRGKTYKKKRTVTEEGEVLISCASSEEVLAFSEETPAVEGNAADADHSAMCWNQQLHPATTSGIALSSEDRQGCQLLKVSEEVKVRKSSPNFRNIKTDGWKSSRKRKLPPSRMRLSRKARARTPSNRCRERSSTAQPITNVVRNYLRVLLTDENPQAVS